MAAPEQLSGEHFPMEKWIALVDGGLAEEDARQMDAHLTSCAACRKLLNGMVFERGGLTTTVQSARASPSRMLLPARVGELIDGRYRLDRLLGMGGMGCVFEAHQVHLNQKVALKLMLTTGKASANDTTRFLREARAVARMASDNICRVLDVGALPNQTPFIAMEYLQGESLQELLDREGKLDAKRSEEIVLEVLDALEEAHSLGIVHRDLKPANIFLSRKGDRVVVKVLDFGVAASIHPEIEQGLGQTTSNRVVGTPRFMAPEQVMATRSIDRRTDFWAIGCILHQMLTGEFPFDGRNAVEVFYALSHHPHKRLNQVEKGSSRLQAVIDRCLAKSPSERFQSVQALRAALLESDLKAGVLQFVSGVPLGEQLPTQWEKGPGRAGMRRKLPWIMGAATVAGLLGLTLVGWGKKEAPRPAPTPEVSSPVVQPPTSEPEKEVRREPPVDAGFVEAAQPATLPKRESKKVSPPKPVERRKKKPALDPMDYR